MSHHPKPWFRKSRRLWYVEIDGRQHNLGPDREQAFERYHRLMSQPRHQPKVAADSVPGVFDVFLDWTQKHRAEATYEWYKERLQWFLRSLPKSLPVRQLRPWHVQHWLDAGPDWSDGHKRGCITAVQRAFRWATKMGYIDRSPVEQIEKPRAGKRETLVSDDLYQTLRGLVLDQEFQDLMEVSWETGCRPQESLKVESRHVDLQNARWVFVPQEAKVKSRPRIVYLTDVALTITKRRMLKWPEGPIFRNTDGRPWTRHAVNCRFGRLKKKLGLKLCLYAFRHTWMNRLLTSGVDALTVAILAGHADPSTLARTYQHLSHDPGYLQEALKRLRA